MVAGLENKTIMDSFNKMQRVKRRFFAMRNGLLADRLRRPGGAFRIIFGLNLPQIAEIAAEFGPDAELARRLWENTSTRESMLMAPMVMPLQDVTKAAACDMLDSSPDVEVTDVVCHRLLRRLPFAMDVVRECASSGRDLTRYGALRLAMNVVSGNVAEVAALASGELGRDCGLTRGVCRQILDEVDFLRGE